MRTVSSLGRSSEVVDLGCLVLRLLLLTCSSGLLMAPSGDLPKSRNISPSINSKSRRGRRCSSSSKANGHRSGGHRRTYSKRGAISNASSNLSSGGIIVKRILTRFGKVSSVLWLVQSGDVSRNVVDWSVAVSANTLQPVT